MLGIKRNGTQMNYSDHEQRLLDQKSGEELDRRPGLSKLVYDKERRTIVTVRADMNTMTPDRGEDLLFGVRAKLDRNETPTREEVIGLCDDVEAMANLLKEVKQSFYSAASELEKKVQATFPELRF